MSKESASVQVLTAEVRTLMVGSRQVTMSVYKQLDDAHWLDVEPFGRVAVASEYTSTRVHVVGRRKGTGELVSSSVTEPLYSMAMSDTSDKANEPWITVNRFEGLPTGFGGMPSLDVLTRDGYSVAVTPNRAKSFMFDDAVKVGEWRVSQEKMAALVPEANAMIDKAILQRETHAAWSALPKIVLAGLR